MRSIDAALGYRITQSTAAIFRTARWHNLMRFIGAQMSHCIARATLAGISNVLGWGGRVRTCYNLSLKGRYHALTSGDRCYKRLLQ